MNNPLINLNDIHTASTATLRAVLAKGLTYTAQALTAMGAAWQELVRRGEDLEDLRNELRVGLPRSLPLIAAGRLAAEAVIAFAGKPLILRRLEGLPLEEQRRLADGAPIPIYLPDEKEPQSMPLSRIPPFALRLAISDGMIRTPAEQRLAMRKTVAKKKNQQSPSRKYHISVNADDQVILINRAVIPISSMIAAMAEAAGSGMEVTESIERPAKTIAAKVTDEEKERVKAAAIAHNLSESELIRKAVAAMWLL